MKTKKQLTMVLLVTALMVTGIVNGESPAKNTGDGTTNSPAGLGWQEQTQRVSVLITDGLRITTGPTIGTSGLSWGIGISSNFTIIECCKPATLKQSWCNFNSDDPRCKD